MTLASTPLGAAPLAGASSATSSLEPLPLYDGLLPHRMDMVGDPIYRAYVGTDALLSPQQDAEAWTLAEAAAISLWTDARIPDDLDSPLAHTRGGWWGDSYTDDGLPIGSLIWWHRLQARPFEGRKIADEARQALTWMLDDGLAADIQTAQRRAQNDALLLVVRITRPTGPDVSITFDDLWRAYAD